MGVGGWVARYGGNTEPMVLVGSENTWAEHSGLRTAHASHLKIRLGQDSNPKIVKFLEWVSQDVLRNPVFELNESE